MKGIYLTEEGKKEIEYNIAEIEKQMDKHRESPSVFFGLSGRSLILKEILSSATILPIYESLNSWIGHAMQSKNLDNPNGVIIKPKE